MKMKDKKANLFGYARVSSKSQQDNHSLATQEAALVGYGVPACNITIEVKSAFTKTRERELDKLLDKLAPGSTLVATRMDRLFRNLQSGLQFFDEAEQRGIHIVLLDMPSIADPSAMGRMMRAILMSFAELESSVRRERIQEAINTARSGANDPFMNRRTRTKDSPAMRRKIAQLELGKRSLSDNAKLAGISRTTYYKIRQRMDNDLPIER